MPYRIAYRSRHSSIVEYTFCSCVISLYAEGCAILRSGGIILDIDQTDPVNDPSVTVTDLQGAIAAEDAYRRECARAGIDYPSMLRLEAT